ncbi:MAG: DEAD/DEAH box helicase [Marmoricola sp.]
MTSSPSEGYARMRARNKHPHFAEFASFYDFALDDFQVKACHHLEDGASVLVAAPTGSGKTLVGEFAVHLALAAGRKCFYTTPIKALSNQKFNDLVERYGAENVGLLTGDNTINGDAPVVVMTTEVLRNMLYAGSSTLRGLAFVVMDEGVHYLADRSRGAVWEEVIIHLPESVALVALSATVSNAEEFGDWLATVRGETVTVVEEKRPVPLFQHVMVGRRLFDLFADEADASAEAKVNPELVKIARDEWASTRFRDRRTPRGRNPRGKNIGNGRRVWIPSRPEMVERLDAAGLLPAIDFIFSRVGCDAAVEQCLAANVRLTTPAERDAIYEFVEAQCAHLPDEDLHVLGYHEFLDGLTRGVAAHHAGMLPTFKECVEQLFLAGLCKVIFATETLALGINMPARSVVIEKLSKWNGQTHADITPGEYTQLTGRAGRRGIDVEGHGVVLWQPGFEPEGSRWSCIHAYLPVGFLVSPFLQHGGQPGTPVWSCHGTRAPRTVICPVPGRQSRRWSGTPIAQGRRGAYWLRRSRTVPSGGLYGVLRATPPALRHRGHPGQSPPLRRAQGGRGQLGEPAPWRRDQRALGQVLWTGRGD